VAIAAANNDPSDKDKIRKYIFFIFSLSLKQLLRRDEQKLTKLSTL